MPPQISRRIQAAPRGGAFRADYDLGRKPGTHRGGLVVGGGRGLTSQRGAVSAVNAEARTAIPSPS